LQSIIKEPGGCQFSANLSTARFETATATLQTRLVEGRFPRWQDVIPAAVSDAAIMTGDDLDNAVMMASVTCDDMSRGVTFEFPLDEPAAILTGGSEKGKSRISMPCTITGVVSKVTLEWRYVSEVAKTMAGESLEFRAATPKGPIRIDHASGYVHVLMPLSTE
jgi:DNA polymerase-3 subunit beta